MAYISGEYTSATSYTITLGGMSIGTVYALLVQDINSDGSSNGFVCKWKSGATSSTKTWTYTTSSAYSRYDRRIGFFQGSFNTDVGTIVSDANFNSWADGEAVIDAWGGGGGSVYTLTAGSMPGVLSSVHFGDGTSITQSNRSCSFANKKYIRSISLTSSGLAWIGTIYWSSSSGGTTYPIADITNGSISYYSSIEPIDFYNESRTIYFTAVGQTTYKYRIHAMTTADGSYFSNGLQDYYAPSSSSWYTSTTVSNTFNLDTLPTPIRNYYKLVGWAYTNTTDTSQAHTGEITVSGTVDGKVNNFYAVWSLAPTIILSANGGVFQDTQSAIKEYPRQTPGTPFYFSGPSGLVSRDGYTLLGWSANDTATTAGYDPDGWVTVGNSTVQKYYAIWQQTRATITFDYNGGRYGESTGPQSVYAQLNSTFTINRTPTKSGWGFAGWERTLPSGATITYSNGSQMIVNELNIVLKALWSKRVYFRIASSSEGVSSYEVRINGSVAYTWTNTGYSSTYSVLYEEGTRIELRPITVGIYEGSTLVNANGFDTPLLTAATSESGASSTSMPFGVTTEGTVSTLPVYTPFNITSAISNSGYSYFSILSLAKSYTYKLYANNGTWISGTDPKTASVKSTEKLNLSSYTTLIRGNYGLLGWHTSSASNIPSYRPSDSIYLTGNLNLYAVWGKYLYIKCGKGTQIVKIKVGSYLNSQTSNSTDYASFLFPESIPIQLTVQLFSGYEVPIKLNFSATASGSVIKTSKITSGNSISFNYPGDNQRYIEVIASQVINYFTWCGSDSTDNTKIKKGQPVSNLTAEAWNRLKATLNLMLEREDITSVDVGPDVGKITITATEFNRVQEALLQLKVKMGYTGLTIPQKVSKNNSILASYFNGNGSLKDATNKIRTQLYN